MCSAALKIHVKYCCLRVRAPAFRVGSLDGSGIKYSLFMRSKRTFQRSPDPPALYVDVINMKRIKTVKSINHQFVKEIKKMGVNGSMCASFFVCVDALRRQSVFYRPQRS